MSRARGPALQELKARGRGGPSLSLPTSKCYRAVTEGRDLVKQGVWGQVVKGQTASHTPKASDRGVTGIFTMMLTHQEKDQVHIYHVFCFISGGRSHENKFLGKCDDMREMLKIEH